MENTAEVTYLFRCPHCGEYAVDERTLRAALTPELAAELDNNLAGAAETGAGECGDMVIQVIAQFSPQCPRPRCGEGRENHLKLIVETSLRSS